jgi:hypothetical protein
MKPRFHLYIHAPGCEPGLYATLDDVEDLKRMTRENPDFTQPYKSGRRAKWWIVQYNPGEVVAASKTE